MKARTTRLAALLIAAHALCLVSAAAPAAAADRLRQEIRAALADPRLAGARVGVHVCALGTGRVLFSHNAMRDFIPASNQKILVAATALRELGRDYQFRTILWAKGRVNTADGVLEGDLVIQGGGDPTLGSPSAGEEPLSQFQSWTTYLKQHGIRRITGDLVVDDSFFDRRFVHPDWPAQQQWRDYCAPVGALCFQDNCVTVIVRPGAAVGDSAIVRLAPEVGVLDVVNRCKTDGSRHSVWLDRAWGSRSVIVGGHVRLNATGASGRITVPDPGLFAGDAFRLALREGGVRLEGKVRLAAEQDLRTCGEWRRLTDRLTPLADVLSIMLKRSQNMYAEQVVKTVGAEAASEGTWKAGLRRIAAMLSDLGFEAGPLGLADGSGLSRNNRLAPALICAVLAEGGRSNHQGSLHSLLAIGGEEGTLKRRISDPQYKSRVRAKSGYLAGVGALSGYADTTSGLRVAFSVLINDFKHPSSNAGMKEIEDRIARAIADYAE